MEKLGIERRLYTSGEHKAMLDPFLPEKPDDVERLKAVQQEIHEKFHRAGEGQPRRAGSTGAERDLFSGEYLDRRKPSNLALSTHRRPADDLARALRRKGAHAADRRRTQSVRPPRWPGVARRRRSRSRGLPTSRSRRWKRVRLGVTGYRTPRQCLVARYELSSSDQWRGSCRHF